VAWFEASRDYLVAHAGLSHHVLHRSLSRLESRFYPNHFVRIHRTHSANLGHVKRIRRHGAGQMAADR